MADKIIDKTDHDAALRATLPTPVKEQPDPFLQMSTGKASMIGITLFGLAAVVVLAVVLYGLNSPGGASSPPVTPSAPTAPSSPAAGGYGGPAAPSAPQTTNNGKGQI
jgi:hypothetical protein